MVQAPSFGAVSSLADARTTTEQKYAIAKDLKNLIVGQDQRKELAVKHGVVQPLADILSAATKATGKRRLEANGVSLRQTQEWTVDDDLRLQAILIIGSLASGGQAFLQPLCAADLPRILVALLSTELGPRLVTAILQGLKALATFWAAAVDEPQIDYDFWSALFNVESIQVFDNLLRQPTTSPAAKQQLRLVADIISIIPENSSNSKALVTNCGVLDTLSTLLVADAVDSKLVAYTGDESRLPSRPPANCIPSILSAISTVISGSNYRAHRLILNPYVRDLFLHAGGDAGDQRALFGARHGFAGPYDSLLPPLHIPSKGTTSYSDSRSNNFPALSTLQSGRNGSGSESSHTTSDIDHSNAVTSWLLVIIRSLQGSHRLIGLRLLALVANAIEADPVGASHRTEFVQKTRERQKQLALLAVPLAVRLVQAAHESKVLDATGEQREAQVVREQACAVLAVLTEDSKELQVAAVDGGAIKHVCAILKKSFDNVPLAKPMWSAKSSAQNDPSAPVTCRLGANPLPAEIIHAMRCRRGALRAIEALAAREDIHRKAIIEAGAVGSIIDSLKPFPANNPTESARSRTQISPKDGNITPVILAACRAAQSMSRSVSVLRTSLIDGGIAKPLIQLLNHPSLEVQIAATDVCCNLLPDFSPMKDDLSDGNVIKMLVRHARSSSPTLRLSSMWALKHLAYGCPREIKLTTLEELGPGWLVGLIQGEQREGLSAPSGGGVSVGLSSANAAGEQVDLLNPSSMDVDEPSHVPGDTMDEDDEDGEVLFDEASSTHYQASHIRSTLNPPTPAFNSKRYLSSIREMEQNDEYTSRKHEMAIQQQALDFIRNIINGDDCAVLSDHLMSQLGSAQIYELLTTKLSPLSRSMTGGRQVYNPTEIVLSTVHIVIHLANASPKHRQMLIAQKPLLQALLPHFNHLDQRVRVMCVWAVNSLTWIEEDGDRRDARQRANELKALGIETAVRALQNDPSLDVRERVKTAIRQFEILFSHYTTCWLVPFVYLVTKCAEALSPLAVDVDLLRPRGNDSAEDAHLTTNKLLPPATVTANGERLNPSTVQAAHAPQRGSVYGSVRREPSDADLEKGPEDYGEKRRTLSPAQSSMILHSQASTRSLRQILRLSRSPPPQQIQQQQQQQRPEIQTQDHADTQTTISSPKAIKSRQATFTNLPPQTPASTKISLFHGPKVEDPDPASDRLDDDMTPLTEEHFYELIGMRPPAKPKNKHREKESPAADQHNPHEDLEAQHPQQQYLEIPRDLATSHGLYGKIRAHLQYVQLKYRVFDIATYVFLALQLLLSAVFIVLGSIQAHAHLAIAVLGAVGAVVGGVMSLMKGQGLPNRLRQVRDDLENVLFTAEELYWDVQAGRTVLFRDIVQVRRNFLRVLAEARRNHPDSWNKAPNEVGASARVQSSGVAPPPPKSAAAKTK